MPGRLHQSNNPASEPVSGAAPVGVELPPYEPPKFPLNPTAQRSFAQLSNDAQLNALRKRLEESRKMLANDAGIINDCLTSREARTKKRRNEAGDTQSDQEVDQQLVAFRDKVEKMTKRMDESVRKMIDNQHGIQAAFTGLKDVADRARDNTATQIGTQLRSQTQNQRRRARDDAAAEDVSEDDQDEEYQDFTPTDPSGGTQNVDPPIKRFQQETEDSKTRYQSHSLSARYCREPDYVNFKRVVHDARYPNDEKALPDPSMWFEEEGGAPAPGVTTRSHRHNGEDSDDDDDDIAVQRAKVSTKCPITLTEFQDPVTSRKCNHSFEKGAIFELMSQSVQKGRVKCPVGGCREELTKADLLRDEVLMRKIKRLQRARALEEEEGGDGNEMRHAEVIGSDDDDNDDDENENAVDIDEVLKEEPAATANQRPQSTQTQGSTRSSGVTDLSGSGNMS
ncbi:hypothetical protein K431DRAFT_290052 [Polychaeton citri CBS 116435]|uniref:SP-RING-type domain-containing protein n=1 Tax=Polychaeton citri CBS 116435 TaxID=1314669 RepID=A0A9P4UVH8_9PEZI|nr:hypothetical protein K431DRAFT_290052 [Polychaeton citri CBS 116435]